MPRAKTQKTSEPENQIPNPFDSAELDQLLDRFAQPIAHEIIQERLPERVKYHVHRLMTSDSPEDREELLGLLKASKLQIAFSVFHSVLSYAREASQNGLNGSANPALPGGEAQ